MNTSINERFLQWTSACGDSRNHSKDDLREEARLFVAALLMEQTESPSQLLAVLLQTLAPAWSGSHATRVCALSTLTGALQACQYVPISYGLLTLLGSFLLTHAGPLERDHDSDIDDEVDEEHVRDSALIALAALLRTSTVTTAEDIATLTTESLAKKIMLATKGVESRVAVAEDEDNDYPMGGDPQSLTISGLSLSPRSRRSLCFSLLQSCVDAIAKTVPSWSSTSPSLLEDLVGLVRFACSCLHGESDPRCLLQLLLLFGDLMTALRPFFWAQPATSPTVTFPIGDVFDAMAPYYPVQFNPPANNPHGITKEGLRNALRSVLCCLDYDSMATSTASDTMLSLSLSIILEQLMPLQGDEPTTMLEKLDAMEDLDCLLFGTGLKSGTSIQECALVRLEPAALRSMSQAMLSVHNEASLAVATASSSGSVGQNHTATAKRTADSCRSLVAKIALACETLTKGTAAWDIFVGETVQSLSVTIMPTPSSRLSIAYMANLCGCGGSKTMTYCLQKGLEPLMKVLGNVSTKCNADDYAVAISGVGAFFSATRTTLIKADEIGVVIIPHPLAEYGTIVVRKLLSIVASLDLDDADSLLRATAAVGTMESILTAVQLSTWSDSQVAEVCQCLTSMVAPLLVSQSSLISRPDPAYKDWLLACAKTVGSVIGRQHVLGTEYLQEFLRTTLLPALMNSAKTSVENRHRYDWMVLAFAACSDKSTIASQVVSKMAETLRDNIVENKIAKATSCARALKLVIQVGGEPVARTFHELRAPSVTPEDVVEALMGIGRSFEGSGGGLLPVDASLLSLPPTEEDKLKRRDVLESSFQLALSLRSAWIGVGPHHTGSVLSKVSNALPPLNEADFLRLAIIIPLLSAALLELPRRSLETDEDKIKLLLPDLTEFVLRPELHLGTRLHATKCIQLLLSHQLSRMENCPVSALANDFLIPTLQQAVVVTDAHKRDSAVSNLQEFLSMLAVLCASAASRGGESSKTADHFVHFFVDLACTGEALFTLGGQRSQYLDLATLGDNPSCCLSLQVASRFGSIFSMEGSRSSQLWKQRISHLASKRIQLKWDEANQDLLPSPGTVACCCYIICSSNHVVLDQSTLCLATKLVALALSARGQSASAPGSSLLCVKELVLATVIKLLSIAPSKISPIAPYLTTGIIRAYASGGPSSPLTELSSKLLALQALESLIKADIGRDVLASTRPAIVSILSSAMNHPSSILRLAAVEVRNVWCLD